MLFKLSLSNIRKSLRDYAIYFFTLIIGVSVFYVFNAIGGQAAMMEVSKNRGDIIELLTSLLSGVSVFVAGGAYHLCKPFSDEAAKQGICTLYDAWYGQGQNFSNTSHGNHYYRHRFARSGVDCWYRTFTAYECAGGEPL